MGSTDPVGTQGMPKAAPMDDLSAIYLGGENFMKRMAALEQRRQQHDEAFERLKIGNDAKAALDEASAKAQEAETRRAEAASVLTSAQQKAAAIIRDAEEQAAAKMAEAQGHVAAAEKTRQDADAYAQTIAGKVAEAEARTKAAEDREQAAEQANADLRNAEAANKDAKDKLTAAAKAMKAREQELTAKIGALQDALRNLSKG